jgi:L-glyceraldehyde 3-phosphate reductase
MLNREPIEQGILDFCAQEGIGFIAFSPLAQGLLTSRYLDGIPSDSRMAKEHFLKSDRRTPELLEYLRQLEAQGKASGRTIAQEALSWVLDQKGVTSVLVGASSVEQLANNIQTIL